MYPDEDTISREKETGVEVVFNEGASPVLCRIPLDWVRVGKSRKDYCSKGYMVIYQSTGEVLCRTAFAGRIELILKNFEVAKAVTDHIIGNSYGIIVKICGSASGSKKW